VGATIVRGCGRGMFLRGMDCTGRRIVRRAIVLVCSAAGPGHVFDLGPLCSTVRVCAAPLPLTTCVFAAAGKLAATGMASSLLCFRVDISRRA